MSVVFSQSALKAWAGGGIALLTPLSILLLTTDQPLTVRTIIASIISGGIGFFAVYNVPWKPASIASIRRPRFRGRHRAEEDSSPQNQGDY